MSRVLRLSNEYIKRKWNTPSNWGHLIGKLTPLFVTSNNLGFVSSLHKTSRESLGTPRPGTARATTKARNSWSTENAGFVEPIRYRAWQRFGQGGKKNKRGETLAWPIIPGERSVSKSTLATSCSALIPHACSLYRFLRRHRGLRSPVSAVKCLIDLHIKPAKPAGKVTPTAF